MEQANPITIVRDSSGKQLFAYIREGSALARGIQEIVLRNSGSLTMFTPNGFPYAVEQLVLLKESKLCGLIQVKLFKMTLRMYLNDLLRRFNQ